MSCNCGNTFAKFLPGVKKTERPKVKIIKKTSNDQEGQKEEKKG